MSNRSSTTSLSGTTTSADEYHNTAFQIRVELQQQPSSSSPSSPSNVTNTNTNDDGSGSANITREKEMDNDNHKTDAFLAYASSVCISRDRQKQPRRQSSSQPSSPQRQFQTQRQTEPVEKGMLESTGVNDNDGDACFLAVFVPPFIIKSVEESLSSKNEVKQNQDDDDDNDQEKGHASEIKNASSSSSTVSVGSSSNDDNDTSGKNTPQHLKSYGFSWIGQDTLASAQTARVMQQQQQQKQEKNDDSTNNNDKKSSSSPLNWLLPQIHLSLLGYYDYLKVKGVISLCQHGHTAAADIVLLELSSSTNSTNVELNEYSTAKKKSVTFSKTSLLVKVLDDLNGETVSNVSYAILKALPISSVSFFVNGGAFQKENATVQMVICGADDVRNSSSRNTGEQNHIEHVGGEGDDGAMDDPVSPLPLSSLPLPSPPLPSSQVDDNRASDKSNIGQQVCPSSPIQQKSIDNLSLPSLSDIPPCPVCLHRIDPQRLGLPCPKNHHLCSHFNDDDYCGNSIFLSPWPIPCYCDACHLIQCHSNGDYKRIIGGNRKEQLCCYKCKMGETLWVCLTCGVVGCGRYSHGHAEAHYLESGHPYSLELVTRRIWDYDTGEFAQRGDLLKCPTQQQTPHLAASAAAGAASEATLATVATAALGGGGDSSRAIMSDVIDDIGSNSGKGAELCSSRNAVTSLSSATVCSVNTSSNGMHHQTSSFDCRDAYASSVHRLYPDCHNRNTFHTDDTPPKKATMIGEEYEALLQSALEDQAQHYEGEISRLRAELTAKQVDGETMTERERIEVESLRSTISDLRRDADHLGRKLLDAQGQEAGYRATYNRLLREQAVMKDILEKIRVDAADENEAGKRQVDDLEQQISDLKANLKMRQQILEDQELSNAQIFGTTTSSSLSPNKSSRRGRKQRRSIRK